MIIREKNCHHEAKLQTQWPTKWQQFAWKAWYFLEMLTILELRPPPFCMIFLSSLMAIELTKLWIPRKAVGDTMPVLLATMMVVPLSKNGAVKSTAASLSALILSEVKTMSTLRSFSTSSLITPFQRPARNTPHTGSRTRTRSYSNCKSSANFSNRSTQKPEQHW